MESESLVAMVLRTNHNPGKDQSPEWVFQYPEFDNAKDIATDGLVIQMGDLVQKPSLDMMLRDCKLPLRGMSGSRRRSD